MASDYFKGIDFHALSRQLIEVRRHIHSNPEPGPDQPETANFLASQFDGMEVAMN